MAMAHYQGGCQCGAVRFAVDLDLDTVMDCNCSRCRRLGSILAFAPETSFSLEQGEGATTEYRFNKNMIAHLFCSTCGIESFARGEKPGGGRMVAVNVRCLDGVDPASLHPKHVDGASF